MAIPTQGRSVRRQRRRRSTSAIIEPRQVGLEDLSLSSRAMYYAMYEVWNLLTLYLSEFDRSGDEAAEDRKRLVEERQQVEASLGVRRMDSDLEDMMVEMIQRMSLPEQSHHHQPWVKSVSSPVKSDLTTSDHAPLPDCLPQAASLQPPEPRGRRRPCFRLDKKWLQEAEYNHSNADVKSSNIDVMDGPDRPRPRRWSCSEVEDIDLEVEAALQPTKQPPWTHPGRPKLTKEEVDRHLQRSQDREWNHCGHELSRVSSHQTKPNFRGFPSLALHAAEDEPRGSRLEHRGRRVRRRHSIGSSDTLSNLPGKMLLSDVVVIATLAGVYYCFRKIKSAFT